MITARDSTSVDIVPVGDFLMTRLTAAFSTRRYPPGHRQ